MNAVLSLGSNLGDREAHLRQALDLLRPAAVSSVWETDPVGPVPQRAFLNLVALVPGEAACVWALAQRAERTAGRTRAVRWGPRTLDVDVVLAGGRAPDGLVLPHPRAHERAFVLAPWLEVDRDAELPGHGPVAALLAGLDTSGVRRASLVLGDGPGTTVLGPRSWRDGPGMTGPACGSRCEGPGVTGLGMTEA